MKYDRRLLKVSLGHSQARVAKPRIGVVARGFDFLEGTLTGMWVSPVTGVLQSTPNSEELDYQTSNAGRFYKFQPADFTTIDQNDAAGSFAMATAQGMHASSAINYVAAGGDGNTKGVGAILNAHLAQNTGINLASYAYGSGTDQDVAWEMGWGDSADYRTGTSARGFFGGQVEVWHQGALQGKGSFGGSGYQFGSAKGGFYARPSDQYVQIRAEAYRDRYLLLTSSVGGVFQFACPWLLDASGNLDPSQAILPAAKAWFRIPKGGCNVVWSAVQYAPGGTAVSVPFALSEAPQDGGLGPGAFAARSIPASDRVSVDLVAASGSGAFDPTQNRCCVRVSASGAPVWIDGTSTRYDPVIGHTAALGANGAGLDVTEYLRSFEMSLPDDPMGLQASFELRFDCPVPGLDTVENRPVKIELVANPADKSAPSPLTLLDGVCGPPEWVDGLRSVDGISQDQSFVRLEAFTRLRLLKDVEVTEAVTFDGSDFCKPASVGDSFVAACLRQAAIVATAASPLPNVDFRFEHVPPQRAGDWAFAGQPGDKWYDVLERGFAMAEALVWGMRPVGNAPDAFYVVDLGAGPPSKGTLYRDPDDAAAAGAEVDEALGSFPALYWDHRRQKLPIEGNVVRVLGFDPATQKPIVAVRSDDGSRKPGGTQDGDWLGATRAIKYESPALTTPVMVGKVADAIAAAVEQRDYVEPFRAFLMLDDAGIPLWRGDVVTLDKALPGGGASSVPISSIRPRIVDEGGGGLMNAQGALAPVAIRLCDYTAHALVGLGGVGARHIVARHAERLRQGGIRGRGVDRVPLVSPAVAAIGSL